MKNQTEVWQEHPDISGIEVSSLGRVRTLDRVISNGNGMYSIKGRVLKQRNDKDGYLQVNITVDGKLTMKKAHRLVAQTFIPNPDNLPQVNHKDCRRANNSVENLEWCDNSYNQKYRNKNGISQTEAVGHPLFAINLATFEVSSFHSQHEVSRALGFNQPYVNAAIKGKYKQAYGYWFVNADEKAVDITKRKLRDIGETGLKVKHGEDTMSANFVRQVLQTEVSA
ncbi:NUMOD4 motif-containing HNH endonuclease [Lactiplantibacillus plantarum]|uniref:NUMOD4 motif-containing HNH endonuclease n=1 Tax=Lactiplantibacillus plantarum TaxID=1590 RepID=UPI002238CEBB|nr:NUMOD4 motif-containing HNH endonuclease [Lactiplantibacillus plantarum]MCW6148355.1 NUMOD4 motif-containing HNH endonuclease [Lactiplantibacillus plantarum]